MAVAQDVRRGMAWAGQAPEVPCRREPPGCRWVRICRPRGALGGARRATTETRHVSEFASRYALPPPRRWGEQNAAMTERSLVDFAAAAGGELAIRLRNPCDIIDVHRLNNSRAGVTRAPFESFFTQLARYAE